jgi:hypothetical protein
MAFDFFEQTQPAFLQAMVLQAYLQTTKGNQCKQLPALLEAQKITTIVKHKG